MQIELPNIDIELLVSMTEKKDLSRECEDLCKSIKEQKPGLFALLGWLISQYPDSDVDNCFANLRFVVPQYVV